MTFVPQSVREGSVFKRLAWRLGLRYDIVRRIP